MNLLGYKCKDQSIFSRSSKCLEIYLHLNNDKTPDLLAFLKLYALHSINYRQI